MIRMYNIGQLQNLLQVNKSYFAITILPLKLLDKTSLSNQFRIRQTPPTHLLSRSQIGQTPPIQRPPTIMVRANSAYRIICTMETHWIVVELRAETNTEKKTYREINRKAHGIRFSKRSTQIQAELNNDAETQKFKYVYLK